jgi:hypothetical protein
MSIKNKNKDHLKEHAGVKLVLPQEAPTSDDPTGILDRPPY